jgi:hypothetical protein
VAVIASVWGFEHRNVNVTVDEDFARVEEVGLGECRQIRTCVVLNLEQCFLVRERAKVPGVVIEDGEQRTCVMRTVSARSGDEFFNDVRLAKRSRDFKSY